MTRSVGRLAALLASLRGAAGRHPDRLAILLLLIVALLPRLAFAFRAPVFVVHDSLTYFESGFEFARGSGFELAFKRTPFYPLFIAAVVAGIGEELHALTFVQHLLGVVTVVLTYLLGRELANRWIGLLAGLMVALSGPLILFEHYILAEALFTPILLGFALLLVHGLRRPGGRSRTGYLLAAGLVLGLAGLVRPVGQAAIVAVPFALLLAWQSWRAAAIGTLVVGAGLAIVLLPWMARNYLTQGSFESAGALGQTLTGRIIRHDEGFVIPDPSSPSPYRDQTRTDARALILRLMQRDIRPSVINHRLRETFNWNEADANRAMKDTALEIILGQRERYVTGTYNKFRRLLWGETEVYKTHWSIRKGEDLKQDWKEEPSIGHLFDDPTPQETLEQNNASAIINIFQPFAWRYVLTAFAVVGLMAGLAVRRRAGVALLVLVTLALVAPSAALVGYVPRYRYPADPYLAVLVGIGVFGTYEGACWLIRRARPNRSADKSAAVEPEEAGAPLHAPEPAN